MPMATHTTMIITITGITITGTVLRGPKCPA